MRVRAIGRPSGRYRAAHAVSFLQKHGTDGADGGHVRSRRRGASARTGVPAVSVPVVRARRGVRQAADVRDEAVPTEQRPEARHVGRLRRSAPDAKRRRRRERRLRPIQTRRRAHEARVDDVREAGGGWRGARPRDVPGVRARPT